MNKSARSKYVRVPSTRRRTGSPNPATSAPTTAVMAIEISGDFNFQLQNANVAAMAISVYVV